MSRMRGKIHDKVARTLFPPIVGAVSPPVPTPKPKPNPEGGPVSFVTFEPVDEGFLAKVYFRGDSDREQFVRADTVQQLAAKLYGLMVSRGVRSGRDA